MTGCIHPPAPNSDPTSAPATGGGRLTAARSRRIALEGFILAGMVTAAIARTGHGQVLMPSPEMTALILLPWLALQARARWPLVTLGVVLALETTHIVALGDPPAEAAGDVLMGFYQPVPMATMIAAFSVAYRVAPPASWIAGGTAAVSLPVVALLAHSSSLLATDMVMANVVFSATAIGWAVRERRERRNREAEERRAETRRQVVAERVRIARELHDSLAHNLTLVNAQIGVASYLVTANPEAAATALKDITRHTRQALEELRATVGLLRQDDESDSSAPGDGATNPVPGLRHLDELVAGTRAAGTSVELVTVGVPVPLTAAADLAAYRIIQEALTNAAKYATGAQVRVSLAWSPGRLDLSVVNAPAPGRHRRVQSSGTGHGLVGMRERAHHVGGTIQAGPTGEGGFAVNASLPIETPEALDTVDI